MDVRILSASSLSKTQFNYFLEFQDKAIQKNKTKQKKPFLNVHTVRYGPKNANSPDKKQPRQRTNKQKDTNHALSFNIPKWLHYVTPSVSIASRF